MDGGVSLYERGDVKKPSTWIKPKGRVDWKSFRAQPLEIEALCRKLT